MEHETPPSGAGSSERRRKERHRAVPLMPEVRHWSATALEVREVGKTNEILISGTPIVYDTPYVVLDMFGEFEERMAPGVAGDVLSIADVRFLYDHDGMVLARNRNDLGLPPTMVLRDTPTGLTFEARLDARMQTANDLACAVERGDISQMSCGFVVAEDEWSESMDQRTVKRFADLLDISAVKYPASPTTSLQIAKRMALEVPVESRARLRRVYADLREGKPLQADRLEAFRSMLAPALDPGDETQTPEGTGRLGSPDGEGRTWANDGDLELPDATPADGTEGIDAAGTNAAAPPQDGTGSRSAPKTAAERREQSMSFGDRQSAVYAAICGQYGTQTDGGYFDMWVCDMGDDWVVWQDYVANTLQRLSYVIDSDGKVTLVGDPQPVAQHTIYQPVERASRLTRIRVQRALRGL